MTIETKLNKGDNAWFMYNNKATNRKVKGLTAEFDSIRFNDLFVVKYFFDIKYDIHTEQISIHERDCFATKQDLLNSL